MELKFLTELSLGLETPRSREEVIGSSIAVGVVALKV
jgi:hypothetical protein